MSHCIVITYPSSLEDPGGGTRSCRQIARHLAQLDTEVILVPVSKETKHRLLWDSVPVMPVTPNRWHYILKGIGVAQQVRKILATKSVDAVISWGYEGAFLPRLLKSKQITFATIAASPSYAEWIKRDTGGKWFKNLVDRWFRWRPYRSSDVVFVSSDFTRQELISWLQVKPERIQITHRGINPIFGQIERSQQPQQITNLIFYGSLAPIKGVFDTISALGQVAAKGYKNWTLKIAGWGDKDAILAAAKEQKIEKQIVFLGCLTPEALARVLQWAHLAILPSRAESFGRAIAEAQAAGLAVVSYDVGSIAEIIDHNRTGWLAPSQRTDLLADAVIWAFDNPQQTYHMGLAGRENVLRRFSWEQTARLILAGIERVKYNSSQSSVEPRVI